MKTDQSCTCVIWVWSHLRVLSEYPNKQNIFWYKNVNIILSIHLYIGFGCSKEMSHKDKPFEYPNIIWFGSEIRKLILNYVSFIIQAWESNLCSALSHSQWVMVNVLPTAKVIWESQLQASLDRLEEQRNDAGTLTSENYWLLFICLFVWFDVLHPSQQLWSYLDSQFT